MWTRSPEHDSRLAGINGPIMADYAVVAWAWRDANAGCLVLRFTAPGESPV